MNENIMASLTGKERSLTPMCNACGWRQGGLHSWNGKACKCGHTSPTFAELEVIYKSLEAANKATGK